MIENDVLRTLFAQKSNEHTNNLKSILNSFVIAYPDIGYCQGMNFVASFLYQLLDYNEEETFYLFCGLMNICEHFPQSIKPTDAPSTKI